MKITISAIFSCLTFLVLGQSVPQGISYQGIARDASGNILSNQPLGVKLGIYTPDAGGTLVWEEVHTLSSNAYGFFYLIIGQGNSTSAGTAAGFDQIGWGTGTHQIQISVDPSGGSSYIPVDTLKFWSVPYAMHSLSSGSTLQTFYLNDLADVDTTNINSGDVLKWNGTMWVAAADLNSDSANFAYYAMNAGFADTTSYAYNLISNPDTVIFAYQSDSSAFSALSVTATYAVNSTYSDTADFALSCADANFWNLDGNAGTDANVNFLGTTDNTDLIFRTNNLERMRLTSTGKVGIGLSAPLATLHIVGNDGFLAAGTFGTGAAPPSGAGSRMLWYPKKSAFRAGAVSSFQWDDSQTGAYSFAVNYNTTASGDYSTAFGKSCTSSGANSLSAGDVSIASGISSVALGSVCTASGPYSIALGRANIANDSGSVAIGYTITASGKNAIGFGGYTVASGDYSIAMGYHASTNNKSGCFVFADMSSTSVTNNTANNQFMVRASGGVNLYSNTALTSGVVLAAGAGSWASVSDKSKKENFREEDAQMILNKLSGLKVTSWNYKSQDPSIRHIGPMAQEFYNAFHFGESDTTITSVDVDGLNLLAIQALSETTEKLKEKAVEVKILKEELEKLKGQRAIMEKRISMIEQKMSSEELQAFRK